MERKIYQQIRAGEDVVRDRCQADIERNRKGLFELVLKKDGKIIEDGARVELRQKDIDFNFGANIFMLDQYDDTARNRLFEQEFLKLFNTASIPLYWEGTEPQQGLLRYDRSTPDDIYRRPPAEKVADWCEAHGLHMKGHPLFWHEFIPAWLDAYTWDEKKKLIAKRFEEIAARFAHRVERFDVVNEPSRVYDVYMRDRAKNRTYMLPEEDYCVWMFGLARQLFPGNKLILNDAVGASFHEFRGPYTGYYLNCKDLLGRGVPIDEIGLQCHLDENGGENVCNGERLYDVLDTYAKLGRTLNISEISIPSVFGGEKDEDLQAAAAEQLYRICFSHPAMTGITWWNLPDDGVLTTKRVAQGENLPSTGLLDGDYSEKAAYKALHKLIATEWRSDLDLISCGGAVKCKAFYGKYEVKVTVDGKTYVQDIHLSRDLSRVRIVEL